MTKEYRSAADVYLDHPKLKEIADRLELSETEASEYNSTVRNAPRANDNPLNPQQQRDRKKHPDYFIIPRWWYRKGDRLVEEKTVYTHQFGKANYEDKLAHVLRTFKPVGIEVQVFKGKKFNIEPDYKETFWFDSVEDDEKNAALKGTETTSVTPAASAQEIVDNFRKELEGLNAKPGTGEDLRLKIIQMQFADQLKDRDHQQAIAGIEAKHKEQIRELQDEIRDKDEYIADLEDELGDVDGELAGLQKQVNEKQKPDTFQQILTGALAKAGVQILVKYPKLTEALSGLSPEQQAQLWKEYEEHNQLEPGSTAGTEASFSAASDSSGSDYSHLTPEHAEMCQIIHEVCKAVPLEMAKKIYTFFVFISQPDGKGISEDKLNKAYAMITMLAEKETKN